MNNLIQIREQIKKADRLHESQLLATKNGEITPYRRSVYKKRVTKAQEELTKLES